MSSAVAPNPRVRVRRASRSRRTRGRFVERTGTRRTSLVRFVRPTYVPRGFGFPERLQNTMKFGLEYTFPAASPAAGFMGFRANSIYQPSFAALTQQPRYYYQFSSVYAKWVVMGSKITARMIYTPNGSCRGGR